MALKLDDRPDQQGDYDDGHPGWRDAAPSPNLDELEESFGMPSAGDDDLPEGHPSRSKSSPSELAAAEAAGTSTSLASPTQESADDRLGQGYRQEDRSVLGRVPGLKGRSAQSKALIAGIGGSGMVGLIIGVGSIFGFLNIFRLDHLLKNIEGVTQVRLQASLDARNDHLVREYIKLRMTEYTGKTGDTDTLYFRANKVDTDNPIRDWYHTLRTSNFEKKVFNDQGIFFTSVVQPNGKIGVGKITIKNQDVDFDIIKRYPDINFDSLNPGNMSALLNKMDSGDFDKFFESEVYGSHKDARKAVKTAVNENTKWWQVMQRRHLRKDISNMTGIKSWRLFETSRDKLAKNSQEIKDRALNKVISKYYADNPSTSVFLQCLFSNGPCSATSDPSSPDNKSPSIAAGDESLGGNDTNADTDEKGRKTTTELDTKGAGHDIQGAIDDAITSEVTDETQKVELTKSQQIITKLVQTITGETVETSAGAVNPAKIWTWAKRIAKIDGLFKGGKDSKIAVMVKNARRAQLVGAIAAIYIADNQIRSGQLVGDEVGAVMDSLKDVGNSEGWSQLTGKPGGANISKEDYCSPGHKKLASEYAWGCDDIKPNGGSRAGSLSTSYANSVGQVIGPLATVVNGVDSSPLGKVINFVNSFVDNVVGFVTGPVIEAFMNATGLAGGIANVMGTVMGKLLAFLGAGPMFTPGDPGFANILVGGGAAMAESTMRATGGVLSTATSLKDTNDLAINYKNGQTDTSVYDRYANINDANSLASRALFNVTDSNMQQNVASLFGGAFGSIPKLFGSLFSGRAFAANPQDNPAGVAQWAGVDTYDIPNICINYDSFSATPYNGTNFDEIVKRYDPNAKVDLDWATVRDTDKFYEKVYAWAGTNEAKLKDADTIYNCNLLNARAMGNLGGLYGYSKDAGYGSSL